MNIGITGVSGFVGNHLRLNINLREELQLIPFEDSFFTNERDLKSFVKKCDVIIHLAAMNRHEEQQVIYDTNISLVVKLIEAMESERVRPHVIFSSSTQEEKDNLYGASKKKGRELLQLWADNNKAKFTSFIIPNVYGPFGLPYYNSFIATFCHQLTHGEQPSIQTDGIVKLIYVQELVLEFIKAVKGEIKDCIYKVPHTSECKVSEVLRKLKVYKHDYFDNYTFPKLKDQFELNLFNTFRSFIDIQEFNPVPLKLNTDKRGSFVETVKLKQGGQVSFSTTKSGVTRGNHYHTRKIERFAVIKGKALIQLRKIGTEEVLEFCLDGEKPAFVDMPIWYTHNIKNIGDTDLYTIFWINEFYDPNDGDTYFEEVEINNDVEC